MKKLSMTVIFAFMAVAWVPAVLDAGQTRVDTRWRGRLGEVLGLVAMIGADPDPNLCTGAAVLVGFQDSSAYLVTANHVLTELGGQAPWVHFRGLGSKQATVIGTDRERDLAGLVVHELSTPPKVQLGFENAGDPEGLLAESPIAIVGCGQGRAWDYPATVDAVREKPNQSSISFQSSYLRRGFSGGALFELFGPRPEVVGLILADQAPNGRAARIDLVLEKMRAWGGVVNLRPYGTTPGCRYSLSTARVTLSSAANARARIEVLTQPDCTWSVSTDSDSWLSIAFQYPRRNDPGVFDAYTITRNQCDGSSRIGRIRVSGKTVVVEQDGTALNNCP